MGRTRQREETLMAGRFGSVLTAMVTPFKEDGSLDEARAADLATWLLDHGSDGLVVAGSTGEAATMADDEKVRLWRAVVEAVDGRGPVIAGTGTYDTAHSIHLTKQAEWVGVDGILLVAPYYNKPPQRGLVAHFATVAGATSLPILVYNVPGRTAVRIEHDTLLGLAEIPNIVGVKDSTGDFDGLSKLIGAAPPGFEAYCGDDWATFGYVCLGAVGVVSVSAHVVGDQIAEMLQLLEKSDVLGARQIHQRTLPVAHALFATTNPMPVKAAIRMMGFDVGPCRLPLVSLTDDEEAKLRTALTEAGVL
jgi:4-hydroxy-tetrahydrodipicolinate synthase